MEARERKKNGIAITAPAGNQDAQCLLIAADSRVRFQPVGG